MNILSDYERYLATKQLSSGTIVTYRRVAHLIECYLKNTYNVSFDMENLISIKGYMISNWATHIINEHEYRVTTRYLYILAAGQFLRFLHKMQYVDFDLSQALPPIPNVEKQLKAELESAEDNDEPPAFQKRAYSQDEVKSMMEFFHRASFHDSRSRLIIALATFTGLRASELAALNISDVINDDHFAKVPRKGTHGRKIRVAIPDAVRPYVDDYISHRNKKGISSLPEDALLVSNQGKRMDRSLIYKSIVRSQKDLDCPTGIHAFRHTALSCLAKSSDPVVARDIANQKSISVTNRYLHTTDEEKLQAVNDLANAFSCINK